MGGEGEREREGRGRVVCVFLIKALKYFYRVSAGFHLATKIWGGSTNMPVGVYSVSSSLGRTFRRVSFLGDFLYSSSSRLLQVSF